VSVVQALVRNVGTCCPDVKGEIQVVVTRGSEYRGGAEGRGNS
jgi:hypothetical protein